LDKNFVKSYTFSAQKFNPLQHDPSINSGKRKSLRIQLKNENFSNPILSIINDQNKLQRKKTTKSIEAKTTKSIEAKPCHCETFGGNIELIMKTLEKQESIILGQTSQIKNLENIISKYFTMSQKRQKKSMKNQSSKHKFIKDKEKSKTNKNNKVFHEKGSNNKIKVLTPMRRNFRESSSDTGHDQKQDNDTEDTIPVYS